MDYPKVSEKIENFVVEKTKYFNGVVLGLSGGIDSAVVASIATNSMDIDRVHCIYMPSIKPGQEDKNESDIKILEKYLGITAKRINIFPIVEEFVRTKNLLMRQNMPQNPNKKLTDGNIASRTRMVLLYAYANDRKLLVLGSSNKSEIEMGYFTKYGDGGCDLEPIGDLYKTEIFEVAKWLGIPEEIVIKKPSAGLWEGQTDEKEIGIDYETLDTFLEKMNKTKDRDNLRFSYNPTTWIKMREMIYHSNHKRTMPEICKLQEKICQRQVNHQ